MKILTKQITNIQELQRLQGFADSFGHKVNEKRRAFSLMDEKQITIGYFQLIETPVIVASFHPDLSKGRPSIEAIRKLQSWSEMQYGESVTAVSHGSNFNEVLPKMGFIDLKMNLFKSQG